MGAASGSRMVVYAVTVVILAGLNLWYWNGTFVGGMQDAGDVPSEVAGPSLDLELESSLAGEHQVSRRDLFSFSSPETPAPMPVENKLEKAAIDPNEQIRQQVAAQFKSIRFLGSLKLNGHYVALVARNGATAVFEAGQEVMPGFGIASVSGERLQVVNGVAAISASYALDGGDPQLVSGVTE